MSGLTEIYRAAREAAGQGPEDEALALASALEATLAALCARGHAAHPELRLDDVVFVGHIGRCGTPLGRGPEAAHAEDLYLACAALAGNDNAVARLRRDHHGAITAYLLVLDRGGLSVDEIEQNLWQTLLVPAEGRPARLATYSGRGPLGAFLGVAAQRIALDDHRHEAAEARARASMAAEVSAVTGDVELGVMRGRYAEAFQQAVVEALEILDDRERMLLRMQLVDGLSMERIGKVYGVSQPTISKWTSKAHQRVLAETRRLLRTRLGLSHAEFESLAGLVLSQLHVSVSRVLRARASGEKSG